MLGTYIIDAEVIDPIDPLSIQRNLISYRTCPLYHSDTADDHTPLNLCVHSSINKENERTNAKRNKQAKE